MKATFYNFLVLTLSFLILTSCSIFETDEDGPGVDSDGYKYPESNRDRRRAKRGKLTGPDGLNLFGAEQAAASNDIVGGVNSYLWKASLDVISFMPISSADAIGGIIITDWYEDSSARGERMKANIRITSKELKASGLKVSLFRQALRAGRWQNVKTSRDLEIKLEDKILSRARDIRIEDERS